MVAVADDIVERLRGWVPSDFWNRAVGEMRDAADAIEARDAEIERLQRWKAESITLLKQWNQIADDVIAQLGTADTLGHRRPDIVASELERLRAKNEAALLIISDLEAEVERLRAAGDALAEVSLGARPWITPLFAMEHGSRISAAIVAWKAAHHEQ